ncbi:hypothetical protein WG66_005943, partial [Moniliophthora roreri]
SRRVTSKKSRLSAFSTLPSACHVACTVPHHQCQFCRYTRHLTRLEYRLCHCNRIGNGECSMHSQKSTIHRNYQTRWSAAQPSSGTEMGLKTTKLCYYSSPSLN